MNAALKEATSGTTVVTADGIEIHQDRLVGSLAKLSATGEHLPADATDHAIVFNVVSGLMEAVRAPGFESRLEHDAAVAAVAQLNFAGYSDWRLPSVPEAIQSVDYSREMPAADMAIYPDAEAAAYWTAQQTVWSKDEKGSSRSFFVVPMHYGYVSYHSAYLRLRARPVRRASPASQCLVLGQ